MICQFPSWRATGAVAVLAASLINGCGGGAAALVIPLFEFGFSGTSGATTIQVFFLPDTPTTASGTFDSVNMNVDALPQIQYSGSYSGCTFKLALKPGSVATTPIAASYDGAFLDNDSITLQPTSGNGLPALTLKRQGTSVRQTGC
jgi:hypothetical protein